MADMTVNAQLDAACEKFRKILEKQLVRIEDMKSQGDFVDYNALDKIRIGEIMGSDLNDDEDLDDLPEDR